MDITADEDVLGGDSRIAGTRIGVMHVYDAVIGADKTPAEVASSFDISLGEVYAALAYYNSHPAEMQELHEAEREYQRELEDRSISPPLEEQDSE